MVSSVASMLEQFNKPNMQILQDMGFQVEVACNLEKGNTITEKQIDNFKNYLKEKQIVYHQIDFDRNALKVFSLIKAYLQLKKVMLTNGKYDFLHCHSPVGGVIGRLVGHKTRTKVIYTAHGFHFYKGAPIINWLIYYPIENLLSWFTDVLITINKEDYKLGEKFHADRILYIPGIGIDFAKLHNLHEIKILEKRKELGIRKDTLVLLSVGELSKRKNHKIPIKALAACKEMDIKYLICGQGELEEELLQLISDLHLEDKVELLGYRTDIFELCQISDIYIFPSLQEGLPVSLMEAMLCGLPAIVSDIRGNNDLIEDGKGGILCKTRDVDAYCKAINTLSTNSELRICMGEFNRKKVGNFSLKTVNSMMSDIYQSMT